MAVAHGRSQHEAPAELAPVPPDTSLESVMFDLILKFLQTPGQVLLVQGPPGSGKTTFALEILNALEETHKIYASSRVAPARLRQHFPWIDEVIDTMSGRTARASWIDELHDLRRVEPDTIFNQVLRLKHSKQRAVLVVDSWEGAIRNTNDEGRKMLESAILSELDESRVSVVIVVEDSRKAGDLGYLVDVDSSVSPVEIRTILNMIRANFINQKGPCVIVPTAAYSSDTVAESLSKYVGWEAIDERVKILEYNQSLAPKKWRLVMKSNLSDDVKTFANAWDQLAKISPHRMLDINVDKAVQVYGRDELSVPGLTELGANMRDTEGLNIAIASTDSKLRDQWLSVVDYHLKIKNADGSLVMYGVKPFTPLYGVDLNFDKGYPVLNLMQIV